MTIDLLDRWQRYMRILLSLSEDSCRSYRSKVEEFLAWLAEVDRRAEPTSISRKDLEDWLEHLFYKGNGNATRAAKITALQHLFRWLVYEEIVVNDITENIPKPKLRRQFVQKFTQAEVYRFFRQCDLTTNKGLRDAAILIMLVFAGLRDGEACNLAMSDLVDDGNHVDVNIVRGKKESFRTVYLWKSPSIIVREWFSIRLSQGVGPNDRLFVSFRKGDQCQGQPLKQSDIGYLIKTLATRAHIRKPKITPHMFRATHISDLRHIRGYDLAAIAERAGHKQISTTDRYIPARGRIHREYPSLAAYWNEFTKVWSTEGSDEQQQPLVGRP